MERYVDMAYLRDGEEPQRWAFCTLGQMSAAAEEGGAAVLSPLAQKTFYPAAKFRLPNSGAPLPFPAYLHCSRNHFSQGRALNPHPALRTERHVGCPNPSTLHRS